MKHFNDMLRTTAVLLLLCTMANAQELRVRTRLPSKVDVDSDIELKFPLAIIEVENTSPHDVHIDFLRVEIKNKSFEVDTTPKLIFQLTPYFDLLVVQATNVGWGPFHGQSFSVFSNAEQQSTGVSLPKLLGVETPQKAAFKIVDESELAVFPLTGQDFTFYSSNPISIPLARGMPGFRGKRTKSTVGPGVPIYRISRSDKLVQQYSGVISSFDADLTDSEGQARRVELLAKKSQLVPLDLEELFWDRQMNAGLRGGAHSEWCLVFGPHVRGYKNGANTKELFGVSVELGDGLSKLPPVPVNITLSGKKPNSKPALQEFWVQLKTDKSASFSASVKLSYHFDESTEKVSISRPKEGHWNFNSTVPKLGARSNGAGASHLFDDLELNQFHRDLCSKDPSLLARAINLISIESRNSNLSSYGLPDEGGRYRRIKDVLSIVLSQGSEKDRELASEYLTRLILLLKENINSQKSSDAVKGLHPLGIELFPLLCKHDPSNATYFAVFHSWASRPQHDANLLKQCLCLKTTRAFLPKYEKEITKHLLTYDILNKSDPVVGLSLAVLSQSSKTEAAMRKAVNSYNEGNSAVLATIVWADTVVQNNDSSDSLLKSIFRRRNPTIHEVEILMASASLFRSSQLKTLLSEWVHENWDRPDSNIAVESFLDFSERVDSLPSLELLNKLIKNPYSHSVRKRSQSLKSQAVSRLIN